MDNQKFKLLLNNKRQEEEKAAALLNQKKKSEQDKWKDSWETDEQLQKFKKTIEEGYKSVKMKEFNLPIETQLRSIIPNSPRSSLPSLHKHKSCEAFFVTEEPEKEPSVVNQDKIIPTENYPQYPWEKRERSREQFRNFNLDS